MGATFWEHTTPYEPDAEAALRNLQAEVFRQAGYDLTRLLAQRVADMEQAVRSCEEDDPYDLLEHYRDCLVRLRHLAAVGVLDGPVAQVALLREIEALSSDSAPGILAIEGVSDEPADWMVQRLDAEILESVFGTAVPDPDEARAGLARLAGMMNRGAAICFTVHEDGRPMRWCFAGFTAD